MLFLFGIFSLKLRKHIFLDEHFQKVFHTIVGLVYIDINATTIKAKYIFNKDHL